MDNIYKGKNVLVLGLGKSGIASAKLLNSMGANVIINDSKKADERDNEIIKFKTLNIKIIAGYHPMDLINKNLDFIVKSPGISYDLPILKRATELDIPIITDIELAYNVIDADFIGITGSNGKTTTTTLVGDILKNANLGPIVAGNIGRPLSDVYIEKESNKIDSPIVLELSSFQLLGIKKFRCNIAAIMNIYPSHLDYHYDMDNYIAAKSNIFLNQTNDDFLILNGDQHLYIDINNIKSNIIFCSVNNYKQNGMVVEKNEIIYRTELLKTPICDLDDIAIPGKHNIENVLFASMIALLKNVSPNIIRNTIKHFKGVEHRIEYVTSYGGAKFYNDSKATNQQATIRALDSFETPVILIAGGLDRGNNFDELIPALKKNVKNLVLLGETAKKIKAAGITAGIDNIIIANSMYDAVEKTKALVKAGDIVLLSPACASWDMFASYEERGSLFKKYVLA